MSIEGWAGVSPQTIAAILGFLRRAAAHLPATTIGVRQVISNYAKNCTLSSAVQDVIVTIGAQLLVSAKYD